MTIAVIRGALFVLSVVAFSIAALRPGLGGVDWQNVGLALGLAGFAIG